MDNINHEDLKKSIKNIINESLQSDLQTSPDCAAKFNIRRYVNGLIEEGQRDPKLMSFLMRTDENLKRGAKDFMLFEQFGKGLEQFSTGNKVIKGILTEMNHTLQEDSNVLTALKIVESISDDYVRESIKEALDDFVADPCDETKSMLLEAIDNLYGINEQAAMNLTLFVSNAANSQPDYFATSYVTESAQEELDRRLEENRQKKMTDNIFKKVERYLDERFNQEEIKAQKVSERLSLAGIANRNGLKLYERLTAVLKSDAGKNMNLKNILMQYTDALAHGAYEERLYETLLQNTSKFDYLKPVDNMRKAIIETVNSKREQIDLTKILEEMKDSYQSYIYVELIQEDVARYVNEPSPANRVQLQNALMPYAADAYINEMIKIIMADDSYDANSLTEKAISIKEQIDIIRQNASVSNIYTPVQYIRENESIFNVHGQYFVKKGNNISVLDKKYIGQLDEKFVELCHLVNDPHVQIFEDYIQLAGSEMVANIYEGYVEINGYKEDKVSLRRLDEMCMKYENYDTNFYIMCSCLLENFDNIAKIDFAKHITLNANSDITADLFKLDENIYMATHNNALMKHTFYRNVNPIFCKNTLNEHMGINVASLFSDLLPDQDKIILKLNETKTEYEKSIEEYENAIEELKAAKEEATSEDIIKELDDAIADSEKKLEDVKAEYKAWQESTDDALTDTDKETDTEGEDDDKTTKKEVSNEPLDKDQVDDYEAEFSQPIDPTGVETDADAQSEETAEVPAGVTDDEFSDMLAVDATDQTEVPGTDGEVELVNDEPVEEPEDDVINTDAYVNPADEETPAEDTEAFPEVQTEEEPVEDDDTDIFADDEESEDNDTITNMPAEEDIPSDEDILIGDDFEPEDTETPDMETVDAETGEVEAGDGEAATDIFGGNTEDPLGTKAEVDTELYNPNTTTSEFNIVNIMFDGNAKEGTTMKSGEVLILRPMVAADGHKYVENDTIHFYLNDADNKPIIQSDVDMSTAMYDAINKAIKEHPQYLDVCAHGVPVAGENAPAEIEGAVDAETDEWDGSEEDKGVLPVGGEIEDDADEAEIPSEIDTDEVDDKKDAPVVIAPYAGEETPEFDIEDDEESETEVEPEATEEDDFNFGDIFTDLADDDEADSDEVVTDPVQTYTDEDGTEIELPAEISDTTDTDDELDFGMNDEDIIDSLTGDDSDEDDDDSVIPESVKVKNAKKVNENRKAILSVKANKK